MKHQALAMAVLGFASGILVSFIVLERDSSKANATDELALKPDLTDTSCMRLSTAEMHEKEKREGERMRHSQIMDELRKIQEEMSLGSNRTTLTRLRHTSTHSYAGVTNVRAKIVTTNRLIRPRRWLAESTCSTQMVVHASVVGVVTNPPFESILPIEVADPVNPKPGMLFKGYNLKQMPISELPSNLAEAVPVITTAVVRADKFLLGDNCRQGIWEGFLKCKRSVRCTILVKKRTVGGDGYVLFLNGKEVDSQVDGNGDVFASHVDMKVGFNHLKLFVQGNEPVSISIKVAESTREPKPISPKDLFYDEKPDPGDVF